MLSQVNRWVESVFLAFVKAIRLVSGEAAIFFFFLSQVASESGGSVLCWSRSQCITRQHKHKPAKSPYMFCYAGVTVIPLRKGLPGRASRQKVCVNEQEDPSFPLLLHQ